MKTLPAFSAESTLITPILILFFLFNFQGPWAPRVQPQRHRLFLSERNLCLHPAQKRNPHICQCKQSEMQKILNKILD